MKPSSIELAEAGFEYLNTPYSRMDCQAFVEKCLMDIGINKNLPGSNAWYREMTWVGTPEECVKKFGSVPKGAFLFILEKNGNEPEKYKADGIGNASHIGIKTGKGSGAIHSSSSLKKVAESTFRDKTIKNGGWNRVGLWNKISYGSPFDEALENGKKEIKMEEINDGSISVNDFPEEKTAKVVRTSSTKEGTSTVNLRSAPNTNSKNVIAQIPFGTTVDVLSDMGEWSWVKYGSKSGYMMSNFLEYAGMNESLETGESSTITVSINNGPFVHIELPRNTMETIRDAFISACGLG